MNSQDSKRRSRPALAMLVSFGFGAIAVAQLCALLVFVLLGWGSPRIEMMLNELSALDLLAICFLSSVLLISMKHLLCLHKQAIPWFSTYVGLGSWAALFYSLSGNQKPHFDELYSLAGLMFAIAVLVYMLKLRRDEILR